MKRFYVTSSPDSARVPFLQNTLAEAISKATLEVSEGKHGRRYVVQIIAVVEPATPPVQVRFLDNESA